MDKEKQDINGEEPRSVDAIEGEIHSTRERMDKTVDALSQKLNPDRYIENAGDWVQGQIESVDTDSMKRSAARIGRKTGGVIQEHPLPIALGALALASIFLPKPSLNRRRDSAQSRENGTEESVGLTASEEKYPLTEKTENTFYRGKEKYPVAMCLGAMAAGFLAAFALPRTRKENKIYGDSAKEFKEKMADQGRQLVNDAKETVREKTDEIVEDIKHLTDD